MFESISHPREVPGFHSLACRQIAISTMWLMIALSCYVFVVQFSHGDKLTMPRVGDGLGPKVLG